MQSWDKELDTDYWSCLIFPFCFILSLILLALIYIVTVIEYYSTKNCYGSQAYFQGADGGVPLDPAASSISGEI